MKLLVLSSRPPWPTTRADQLTVYKIIRFLVERGHEVDLIAFVEDDGEDSTLREGLGGVCHDIDTVVMPRVASYWSTFKSLPGRRPMQVAYYHSPAMHRLVKRRVAERSYDMVYAHLIRMAEYARNLAIPAVLGMQISQSLNLSRLSASNPDLRRRFFYASELSRVAPYEAEVAGDFRRVILCGQADVDAINQTQRVDNAEVCPHGQDIPDLDWVREAQRAPSVTAMSGVMATYTNVTAAHWYAGQVLPLVRARVPDASFQIIGRRPQKSIQDLHDPPRIDVTGEVESVADHLRKATVAVVPVHAAAGMQNKIIQAMACELPVVATSVANEGIRAVPGREILIADSATDFADAVVTLLSDGGKRLDLARAGRRFVERDWTWEKHFNRLEEIFEDAVGLRSRTAENPADEIPVELKTETPKDSGPGIIIE